MTSQRLRLTLGLTVVLLTMQPTASATAESCGKAINCNVASGGATVGMTRTGRDHSRQSHEQTRASDSRSYEYQTVSACELNTRGAGDTDASCLGAIQACAGNTPKQGQGPLARIQRLEVDANGNPTRTNGWQTIGTTCFPELGPNSRVPGRAGVGMAQILAAFHNTPWAKPTVHIQPEGNVTLVTLATYFEVKWPTAGFQPGEIDTTTLLGSQVRIRPTVRGYTYVFGDGTRFGPTPSPGGTYPDGDISHTYSKAGTYNTRIDITYGGEFSVGGGAWTPIPDTVTVAGQLQPLRVRTAHARLVTR